MSEITDRSTQIVELANQAVTQLKELMSIADAEDKKVAFQAYRDVLRLIGRITVEEYDGRTTLLSGLVAELVEVTRSVRLANPVAAQLQNLAGITTRALDLLKTEKKDNESKTTLVAAVATSVTP